MLTNLALPCALLFLGISAVAITVRGEGEVWDLANLGRRIKAEISADAMVVTNEMSMVKTFYASGTSYAVFLTEPIWRASWDLSRTYVPAVHFILPCDAKARKNFVTYWIACSRSLRMITSLSRKSVALNATMNKDTGIAAVKLPETALASWPWLAWTTAPSTSSLFPVSCSPICFGEFIRNVGSFRRARLDDGDMHCVGQLRHQRMA